MDAKKLDIAILLFPGVTAQDFIGPHTILSLFGNIRLCWKDKNPVATDSGIRILPDTTFAECRNHCIVQCTGGFQVITLVVLKSDFDTFMQGVDFS